MTTLNDFFLRAKLKHPVPMAQYIELKNDPWESQVSGLNKLLTEDRFGLYDQPACGKTMIAQAACLYWISEGNRCICLMPPTLIYQFYEELLEKFIGVEKYVKAHVFDNSPEARRLLKSEWTRSSSWPQIMIMSYQMYALEKQDLMQAGYQIMVCDEAQTLKDSTKSYYAMVNEFAQQPGGAVLILMTGTPAHNGLKDAYGLISLTYPEAYRSLRHFENVHCRYEVIPFKNPIKRKKFVQKGFRQLVGYKQHEQLNKNLYAKARRVLKKDIFEIRDPSIMEVPVYLDTGHMTLYKKLFKERILEKKEELIVALNPQALRQKMLQIVTCPELFVDEMKFKNRVVEAVQTIIDGMDISQTKVVIFANYQDSVRTLAKYFEKLNPALMYGDSDSETGRKKFLTDDTCRVLIANPKSAGVGLNLQHICHTIIFAEPTGVPGDFQQAMDRVVRYGQKNLVNVYIVKAMGTIAPRATAEMRRKEEEIQKVYKDWHSFITDFGVVK